MFPTTDNKLQRTDQHITLNHHLSGVYDTRQVPPTQIFILKKSTICRMFPTTDKKLQWTYPHIKINSYLSDVSNNRQKVTMAKTSYYNKPISVGCLQHQTHTTVQNFTSRRSPYEKCLQNLLTPSSLEKVNFKLFPHTPNSTQSY